MVMSCYCGHPTYAILLSPYSLLCLVFSANMASFFRVGIAFCRCSVSGGLEVVIWDDAFIKLERLFIIFGAVLLLTVVLSVCVFCSSLFVSFPQVLENATHLLPFSLVSNGANKMAYTRLVYLAGQIPPKEKVP